jgi:hypothetical protein
VDVDNHDEDAESAFGDRDVAWEKFQSVADKGKLLLVGLGCSV